MKTTILSALLVTALFSCGVDSTSVVRAESVSNTERGGDIATEESQLRTADTHDAVFESAAKEFNVPSGLLKALSFSMTRYESIASETEFDGVGSSFGIMALNEKALVEGAALAKVTTDDAKTNLASNVRAAAAYLAAKAHAQNIDTSNLTAWSQIIGEYANIEEAEARENFVSAEVFSTLKLGVGRFSAEMENAGQAVSLESRLGEFSEVQQKLAPSPDFGGAIWRPSPNFGTRSTSPKMVIIHTCEGNYSGCWGWLVQARAGVAAHYVVSSDGSEISQLVRESNKAFHIAAPYDCARNGGSNCALNQVGSNEFTIGIEHAGFGSQKTWSSGEINASAKLVCDITKSWGIPRDRQHIVGHGQLQPWNRTDPGAAWPWAAYMRKINEACFTTGAPPPSNPPPSNPPPTQAAPLIIDSNNANNNSAKGYLKVSANWISSSNVGGYYGTGYFYAPTSTVADGAAFWFKSDVAGSKTIEAWWAASSDRSSSATFVAVNAQGARVGEGTVNQKINGGKWNTVGTFNFTVGWNKVILSRVGTAGSVVVVDGLRIR
jgi:hypothetical protein